MIKKGKFIVIEGTDASGKTTQLKLLKEKLQSITDQIAVADFPRYYDSPFGKLVGEFLAGEHGKFRDISPYLALMPYMLDQYTWSRDVGKPFLEKGGFIVSNRYFTSNVHQIAKLDGDGKERYRTWLWPLGYDHLGLIKPDLVIFLDVPPEIGRKLNKEKTKRDYLNGKKEDEAEKDYEHQERSYAEYLYTLEKFPYWVKVGCIADAKLESASKIHEKVWNEVNKLINKDLGKNDGIKRQS